MKTSPPVGGKSVPVDMLLSAVANEQRRAVLRLLSHTDGEAIAVRSLTDQVAQHVRKGGPLTDEHRQRVRTALHHVHLPKLEACGMIVHDTNTEQVRSVNGELGRELLAMVESYRAPG